MSYSSQDGRRPNEYASKSSHGYIIKDPEVLNFLNECNLPKSSEEISLPTRLLNTLQTVKNNPIKIIIAIDGGYTEVVVKKEFPSSTINFLQFGPLLFSTEALAEISQKPFIEPEDMAKLNNIQRFKLAVPTKNILLKSKSTLTDSIRQTIFDFFCKNTEDFIGTLKWFVFEEYGGQSKNSYTLSTCPSCGMPDIVIDKSKLKPDYTTTCPNTKCGQAIFLTDVFRLHEAIDDELGGSGILGYLTTLLEQIIVVHLIKNILSIHPALLNEILFIKDGPLAFFGQTANMHKLMRNLINYLQTHHTLYLAGLEKHGHFVEHADEISKLLKPGQFILLDNDYIYNYILPGKADATKPYAWTSYYSGKLIFKSEDSKIYVISIPTQRSDVILNPQKSDYKNIDIILTNIQQLKCDMYDNSLFPVALVNKLVSLANHPSSTILEKFAKQSISK